MRRVTLSMLTPDMRLGRSICHGNSILIREGTADLGRYAKQLEKLGIYQLYIEDASSEGILIEDIVSDKTRRKCKTSLGNTFEKIKSGFTVHYSAVETMIDDLLSEILSHPDTLVSLGAIGSVDESTLEHSVNATVYAICLGVQLGYGRDRMKELAEGTLLHDIGKTVLDQAILFKSQKLTEPEFELIKTHSAQGYEILKKMPDISESSRQIALCHHERLDGSGYPNGIKGNEIPEFSRIAAIVDVYEALTADRCYRKAMSPYHALEILSEESASKLDLKLTSKFMQNVAAYPNGSMVRLSDGNPAIVKSQNPSMPLRPVVRVVKWENGKLLPKYEVDLMKVLNLTIAESEDLKTLRNGRK